MANNRYFIGNFDGISFTAIDDRVTTKPNQTNHKYQRSRQFPLFFFTTRGGRLITVETTMQPWLTVTSEVGSCLRWIFSNNHDVSRGLDEQLGLCQQDPHLRLARQHDCSQVHSDFMIHTFDEDNHYILEDFQGVDNGGGGWDPYGAEFPCGWVWISNTGRARLESIALSMPGL